LRAITKDSYVLGIIYSCNLPTKEHLFIISLASKDLLSPAIIDNSIIFNQLIKIYLMDLKLIKKVCHRPFSRVLLKPEGGLGW
jgi:hypothetical protein